MGVALLVMNGTPGESVGGTTAAGGLSAMVVYTATVPDTTVLGTISLESIGLVVGVSLSPNDGSGVFDVGGVLDIGKVG